MAPLWALGATLPNPRFLFPSAAGSSVRRNGSDRIRPGAGPPPTLDRGLHWATSPASVPLFLLAVELEPCVRAELPSTRLPGSGRLATVGRQPIRRPDSKWRTPPRGESVAAGKLGDLPRCGRRGRIRIRGSHRLHAPAAAAPSDSAQVPFGPLGRLRRRHDHGAIARSMQLPGALSGAAGSARAGRGGLSGPRGGGPPGARNGALRAMAPVDASILRSGACRPAARPS